MRKSEYQKLVEAVNTFAIHEGWFLANDGCEIQADDSDDVGRGFKLGHDENARDHVKTLAAAGSALHKKALALTKS